MSILDLQPKIRIPLRQHPSQTGRRDNQRANKPALELCAAESQPLSNKMQQSKAKSACRKVIYRGRGNVVGGGESDNGGEEGPGTEQSRGVGVRVRATVG